MTYDKMHPVVTPQGNSEQVNLLPIMLTRKTQCLNKPPNFLPKTIKHLGCAVMHILCQHFDLDMIYAYDNT